MPEKQGFLAISESGSPDVRYFGGSDKGLFEFSFVDFAKARPLKMQMAEMESPGEPEMFFQPGEPAETTKESYLQLLRDTINFIEEEKLGKIVISRAKMLHKQVHPFKIFKALVEKHPAATVYLFSHPQAGTWAGATPETLLTYDNSRLDTMSLAGTIPISRERDFTEKEREEQQMVTDFIFDRLHENPAVSEIKLSDRHEEESAAVIHLRTLISARLSGNFKPAPLLDSLHPTPAVSGLPRSQALEWIHSREGYQRSYYSGYFGLRSKNQGRYFVNLRCMQIFEDKVALYAGGGVTANSHAESEWEETNAKLATIADVLSTLPE